MKTLVDNATKQSKYVWADSAVVTVDVEKTYSPDSIIGDMNSTNATLVLNVTPPDDWFGCKYLYDTGIWTLNPDWVNPYNN